MLIWPSLLLKAGSYTCRAPQRKGGDKDRESNGDKRKEMKALYKEGNVEYD